MTTLVTDDVRAALEHPQVMDITTTGRHSGQPRRIELVYHNVDGRILICGDLGVMVASAPLVEVTFPDGAPHRVSTE